MPKQTFFNLPAHKRNTLIEAAEKEFSRVPLYEASIANIIKTAGIPRGSFYQYFENKEDFYFYLLDEKLKASRKIFISSLKKHNGDFIEASIELYYDFLVKIPDEKEHTFLKNALLHATNRVENSLMNMFDSVHDSWDLKEMTDLIDKKRLDIKDDQELFHILQIVTGIATNNFIRKISKKLSDDEAIKHFMFEIDLIKYGIYRRE